MVSLLDFSLDIIVAGAFASKELQVRHGDKLQEETEKERFKSNYGIPFFDDPVVAIGCTCDSRFKPVQGNYVSSDKMIFKEMIFPTSQVAFCAINIMDAAQPISTRNIDWVFAARVPCSWCRSFGEILSTFTEVGRCREKALGTVVSGRGMKNAVWWE